MSNSGSSNRPFPAHTLEKALIIVSAIADKGGSKAMDRLLVADAIGRTPSSSEFKRLLSSSRAYGLTIGTEKADTVQPTDLGLRIVKPTDETEALRAKLHAALNIEIISRLWKQFDRQKLPEASFLKNTLERSYGLVSAHAEELARLSTANATFCGVLQDISGSKYIRLSEPVANTSRSEQFPAVEEMGEDEAQTHTHTSVATPAIPMAETVERRPKLFLAHGKNIRPLEELKKILANFEIPYVVAIDEPHAGRPISAKVAQLMRECTAGIFVFTKDELFFKEEDGSYSELWRPSENVVYELGAAGILWEKKIILLKEDGVSFPSDFSDLGYITFTEGNIASKAMEIVRELITFKILMLKAA